MMLTRRPQSVSRWSRLKNAAARLMFGISRSSAATANIRARREAAMLTDETRRVWEHVDGLSADSSLDPGTRTALRNRARYEVANDSYCRGQLETLASDTIGDGPTLQVQSEDPDANSLVEQRWFEWATAIGLPAKLFTMRFAQACDGEAFGVMTTNPGLDNPVKLDLRLHEAEQIADPTMGFGASETDGINLDRYGNVVSYTLLTQHPGSRNQIGFGLNYVTVPARDMLHLFKQIRPGQHRGTPEIEPAIRTYSRRRSYLKAVGMSAESAAGVSWVVETDNPPGGESDADERPEDFDVLETVHGKGMVLPSGSKMAQLKAEQPASTADMLNRIFIAEQARCIGQPYNIAAADSSGANFSSANLDHRQYFRGINRERAVIIEPLALDRLFAAWWEEARLIPGYLPESVRYELPQHVWRWNSQNLNDPLKEAQAQEIRLRTPGLTTLADECAREGKDWEANLRQRARELELMDELRISTAQPSAPASPSTPQISDQTVDGEDGNQADPQGDTQDSGGGHAEAA